MIVLGCEFSEGGEFFGPDEGNVFIIVDIIFENKGSEAEIVSSLLQMELKDSASYSYNVSLFAVLEGASSPEGEIAPGEKLRGPIGFEIPTSAEGLIFVFDADIFGTGKVFVQLADCL